MQQGETATSTIYYAGYALNFSNDFAKFEDKTGTVRVRCS